ncbi:hypothetical protein CEXT_780301, partial [Caerostris extrusa]
TPDIYHMSKCTSIVYSFLKEMSPRIQNDSCRSRKRHRLLNERGQDRWIGHAGKCIFLPRMGVRYSLSSSL